jgi:hypothetical protein
MSTRGVDELIRAALAEHTREVAGAFGLTEAKRQAVLTMQADALAAFAAVCPLW